MSSKRSTTQILIGLIALGMVGFVVFAVALNASRSSSLGVGGSGGTAMGESLFQTRCIACHTTTEEHKIGPGLAGLFAPGGPTLPEGIDYGGNLSDGAPITNANVAAFIAKGGNYQIGYMPPIALTNSEMDALIAYLQTLQKE